MVFKKLYVLVLLMTVASALEGLRVTHKIVIWTFDTLDNNLEIKNHFAKYLKESCW